MSCTVRRGRCWNLRGRVLAAVPLLAVFALGERVAAEPPPGPGAPRSVILDFQDSDLDTVLHAIGKIAGINFVLAPDVRGRITIRTAGKLRDGDVPGLMLSILEVHGFTAVPQGSLYKIVRSEHAKGKPISTRIGAPAPGPSADMLVTQVIALAAPPVDEVLPALRALVSPRGHVDANRKGNVLIVVDTDSNVRRILDVVGLLQTQAPVQTVEVIPVLHLDAAELASVLTQLVGTPRFAAMVGADEPLPPAAAPRILADRRSNALVLRAAPSQLDAIRRLVRDLDTSEAVVPALRVYKVEHGSAGELAAALNAVESAAPTEGGLRPAARVIPDKTSNSLIIAAPPDRMADILAAVRSLDRAPAQVSIEVTVAEVRLTEETRLGIGWALMKDRLLVFQQTMPVDPLILMRQAGLTAPGLSTVVLPAAELALLLNAFAAANRLTIISNPRIVTSENKKAVLNVSDSVPIVTVPTAAVGATAPLTGAVVTEAVDYKDIGVILTVVPRIGRDGAVTLDIKVETSEIGPPQPPTGSRSIVKRVAEASAVLTERQTLVLGGVIRDRRGRAVQGLPVLKDVPVLGRLFGATADTLDTIELVILVRPVAVTAVVPADRMSSPAGSSR